MKKRFHNLDKLDSSQYALSMNCFIVNYLKIVDDFSSLTHENLTKKIKPLFVIPVSYDYVNSNFEELLNGNILWVKDCHNKSCFYVNPDYLKEAIKYESLNLELKKISSKSIKSLGDLQPVLDIYQKLEKIEVTIKILKANHQYGKLIMLKEHCDIETNLRQVGIFDQKRKVLSLSKI